MDLTVSDVSAKSPDMSEAQFAEFVEDIKKNGQLVPIWILDGRVIDGRKRLRACRELGIEPKTVETWPGQDAEALSRSLNALRTHYTVGQLAMFAANIKGPGKGWRKDADGYERTSNQLNTGDRPVPVREAAKQMGVGIAQLVAAKRIQRDGAPEVVEAVKAGKLSLHSAGKIIDAVPRTDQAVAVSRVLNASKGNAKQTPVSAALNGSQVGRKVQTAAPVARQWNELLNQAEFAADNLEASADRAAQSDQAAAWASRIRGVRATLSKVIHLLEGSNESEAA